MRNFRFIACVCCLSVALSKTELHRLHWEIWLRRTKYCLLHESHHCMHVLIGCKDKLSFERMAYLLDEHRINLDLPNVGSRKSLHTAHIIQGIRAKRQRQIKCSYLNTTNAHLLVTDTAEKGQVSIILPFRWLTTDQQTRLEPSQVSSSLPRTSENHINGSCLTTSHYANNVSYLAD